MTTASVQGRIHTNMQGLPDKIRQAWAEISSLARTKGVFDLFTKEGLARFSIETLQDRQICDQILAIFKLDLEIIQAFIQLITTSRSHYYSKKEIEEILTQYSFLIASLKGTKLPKSIHGVPHFDQGGKKWLQTCIQGLNLSDVIQEQVHFLKDLPSLEQIKKAKSVGYGAFHRDVFKVDPTQNGQTNDPTILSVDHLFTKEMLSIGRTKPSLRLPAQEYVKLVSFLRKSNGVFSESDCVHLMQIVSALTRNHPSSQNAGATEALIYWYKTVKETQGEMAFLLVSNPDSFTSDKTAHMQKLIQLLQWIVEIGEDTNLKPHLLSLCQRKTTLAQLLEDLEQVKQEIEKKKYPEKEIKAVLEAFATKGGLVSTPISPEELKTIADQFSETSALCKQLRKCDIAQLVKKIRTIQAKEVLSEKDKLTVIAIAREAIRLKFKIYPYNTQVLALLGILNHPENFKGRIAQVRTGEGKSTVITMLAFYNACLGHTVDIISSSRYLAKRDQEKYYEFYKLFGISTSHICIDNPKEDNFKGQIIFGTNSDFEFAVMRDSIREKRVRVSKEKNKRAIERPFNVVIVDEVDNLFIDTALNSARISIPSKGKYGWVYQPTLSFAKENILPLLFDKDLSSKLRNHLASSQGGKYKAFVESINDQKLKTWLSSALTALVHYQENQDYVLKLVEKQNWAGKTSRKEVVLVDKTNTGRLQPGMRLGRGAHEFLEAKHNLVINAESAVSASLSHPVFFESYRRIYGLTGTLGSPIERKEVEKIYGVDSFDVPPHKPNLRKLLEPRLCHTKEIYFEILFKEIQEMVKQNRPTLVLLESIDETKNFAKFLKLKNVTCQVLNERQSEHEYFIIARAGAPGMVTIATNTAGRGTDIVLHPTSLKQGGLHVIFGFYPENDRVEEQGFGRSGRQGQPGTGRMALLSKGKQTIQELTVKREKRTGQLSEMRMKRVECERENHGYLTQFLKSVRKWHDTLNTKFMKKAYDQIHQILEKKPKSKPAQKLEGSDLKLFTEFQRYLEHPGSGKHFLEQFIEAAKYLQAEKILLEWAESFYGELDDLRHNLMKDSSQEKLTNYPEEVKKLYLSKRTRWEKYLNDPENGFWAYLERITGLSREEKAK